MPVGSSESGDTLVKGVVVKSEFCLNDEYGSSEDFERAISELRDLLPSEGSVVTDEDVLSQHGLSTNDYHPATHPTVVVYAHATMDVVIVVQVSAKYKMPIVPYAGATSVEGQFRASSVGGISLDLSRMNRILEIHESDADLVCEAGAEWTNINKVLREKDLRLFFPIDPGVGATIGGIISTGCSGTNAVRYGTTKAEWILNVTVVLPNGEVIKTKRRSRKCAAGFDTTKLFIGAEGTLGIITEATIRLAPLLETTVGVVHFPDVRKATEAVTETINRGAGIQCAELCDDNFMIATNRSGKYAAKWPELDTVLFKFQGPTPRAVQEAADIAREVTEKHGGVHFHLASSPEEAQELWLIRKNGLDSAFNMYPGCKAWATDVCVPVSRLPDLVYDTKQDITAAGLRYMMAGHVGDGNFHALLLFTSDEELEICRELISRLNKRAVDLDGTCTGEHGVGIGKRRYLTEELGEGTVALMKTIKHALDPYNLFNPGKLYPD